MSNRPRYHARRLRAGRWSEAGRPYLVTIVTHERRSLFSHWAVACACARCIHQAPGHLDLAPLAWVIMPDHLHWLFVLGERPLADVLCRFKGYAAHRINQARGHTGSVWQRGYHDHAVRRERDLRALARYVITNPIRAGLCERAGDYPFWDAAWL